MPDPQDLAALVAALRTQRQIDMDGCEVAVSRQACDEAADALAYITDLEARLAAAEALALEYEHRHQRALSLLHEAEAGEDALAEALRPFGFFSDEPNTTQQAWEIRYCDRFEDWIDFGDMESARDALAAYEARREK